jgi:hypothetical protein
MACAVAFLLFCTMHFAAVCQLGCWCIVVAAASGVLSGLCMWATGGRRSQVTAAKQHMHQPASRAHMVRGYVVLHTLCVFGARSNCTCWHLFVVLQSAPSCPGECDVAFTALCHRLMLCCCNCTTRAPLYNTYVSTAQTQRRA